MPICLYTHCLTSAWSKHTVIFCMSVLHAYFTLALVCIWRSPQSFHKHSLSPLFFLSALRGKENVCRTETSIQLNLFLLPYNDFMFLKYKCCLLHLFPSIFLFQIQISDSIPQTNGKYVCIWKEFNISVFSRK